MLTSLAVPQNPCAHDRHCWSILEFFPIGPRLMLLNSSINTLGGHCQMFGNGI